MNCRQIAIVVLMAVSASQALATMSTTSPGKTAVFGSEDAGSLSLSGSTGGLSGTISKGKRGRVLQLAASLSVAGDPAVSSIYLQPFVNGTSFNPLQGLSYYTGQCDTAAATDCTISITAWLDLDAAEAAHPGTFIGKPLSIGVYGGAFAFGVSGLAYRTSFAAELVKK